MLKCISAAIVAVVLCGQVYAYEVSVGTNSVVVLPARSLYASHRAWAATNQYANGQYVSISGVSHMCLVGGTSGTNAPALAGDVVSDGTVSWVRVAAGGSVGFALSKRSRDQRQ